MIVLGAVGFTALVMVLGPWMWSSTWTTWTWGRRPKDPKDPRPPGH